jgi:hypothetical protein
MIGRIQDADVTMTNVTNTGAVNGSNQIGGMIGFVFSNVTLTMTDVTNTGDVSGSDHQIGGMIGIVFLNVTLTMAGITNTGDVSGSEEVGGMIGSVLEADVTMTNVTNTGAVNGSDEVGGMIGKLSGSVNLSISSSSNFGDVNASLDKSGGIIGFIDTGVQVNITSVANLGDISGLNQAGGINGRNQGDLDISYVYNAGNVSVTNSFVGAIVGENISTFTLTNVFYLTGTAINFIGSNTGTTNGNATRSSIAELSAISTFADASWDIERYSTATAIWYIQYNGQTTYPWLTSQGQPHSSQIIDVIPVFTGSDLKTIEDNLFGSFELENNIDLSSYTNITQNFIPGVFTGTLDGKGFMISNFTLSTSEENSGLFHQMSNATFKNFTLNHFSVTSSERFSALLVARATGINSLSNITITNSSLTSTCSDCHKSEALIGALIAVVVHSPLTLLTEITQEATVAANQSFAGGFIGLVGTTSSVLIESSTNAGNISAYGNAGAFVGKDSTNNKNRIRIRSSINTGTINGNIVAGYFIGNKTSYMGE